MKNLRIIDNKVTSNTVELYFNKKVSLNITSRNFVIQSETEGTPDVEVLGVIIDDNKVTIETKPITYGSVYKVVSRSTHDVTFLSRDEEYILLEDGINNETRIVGPVDIDNPVFENFRSLFKDNIYDIDNNDTFVNKYLRGSANELEKAYNAAAQLKSDRFLSFDVIDEEKVRGRGSFDRLNNEGTYLVTRVALTPTSQDLQETVSIEFGEDVISLSQKKVNLTFSTQDENFFTIFDINNLIFNLDKNLIKISSLNFTFLNANPNFKYDLDSLGYQLLESKYDSNSYTNLQLKSNQAKLSDNVLLDSNFDLANIYRIEIEYFVNDTGKTIDYESLSVYAIKDAIREETPAIQNVFSTKHAPIVDANGNIPELGGLVILNVETFTNSHPAFKYEIKFDLQSLPARFGEYAVDYALGKVYVYGSNNELTGTGDIPPAISYKYKYSFTPEIDYVFDDQANDQYSLNDIVALPYGSLIDTTAFVNYSYDIALARGTDYEADIHIESLNERVENRFKYPNVFLAKNIPITGVFRVYNETSGEIYEPQRFSGNKIYVAGTNSPQVNSIKNEKVSFQDSNEILIVSDELLSNTVGASVYKIYLKYGTVISQTEFGLGYSQNSSVVFSDQDIFQLEKYYVQQSIADLLVGQYMIDYSNGIIYVCVNTSSGYNIGSVLYKYGFIKTEYKHVTNVFDITKKNSIISSSEKQYQFGQIEDQAIQVLDIDNQLLLDINNIPILNISNVLTCDTETELFSDYQINGIYNYNDLVNSNHPTSFPYLYADKTITLQPFTQSGEGTVEFNGTYNYINTGIEINYINTDFTYAFTATKQSDGSDVQIAPHINFDIVHIEVDPGLSVGEVINFTYTITPNDITRFVVDFTSGDLYVDYEYLADEIIISYEYGDNVLDFRTSDIEPDTTYYVSYKAGALREGLNNFAQLLKIPELQVFDSNYERESFRDALQGGLSSFLLGSTTDGINNIVNSISHINPEIKETLFEQWILGDSFLHSNKISLNASSYEKTKYALAPNFTGTDSLQIPFSSNFNLEEGTFSTWFKAGKDILENTSDLTVTVSLDGYDIDPKLVFLGSQGYHPDGYGSFVLNKNNILEGKPQFNKEGVFIYIDNINNLNKWNVHISGETVASSIKVNIQSNHKLYMVSKDEGFSGSDKITTKSNGFVFTTQLSSGDDRVLSFISGEEKYILDTNSVNKNRMSLFFNPFGYLVFQVYDNNGKSVSVSSNCSSWKAEDLHYIGIGWKLNTVNRQDEIHLFIDGQESLNLNYWGENYDSIMSNTFGSKHLDRFVGSFSKNIIGSIDLSTTAGSYDVTSSVNFSAYSISPGDIIYINEPGFDTNGYVVSIVAGQTLTLTTTLPQTISNGKYSVNRASLPLKTKDWLYPDICVLKTSVKLTTFGHVNGTDLICVSDNYLQMSVGDFITIYGITGIILEINDNFIKTSADMGVYTNVPWNIYSHDLVELKGKNTLNPEYYIEDNNLFVTSNVSAGDLVFMATLGVNSEKYRSTYYVWQDDVQNVVKTRMPTPIDLDSVSVYHQVANVGLTKDNTVNSAGHFTYSHQQDGYELSVSDIGRFINVKLSGRNIDFTDPLSVTINGEDLTGLTSETLFFTEYTTLQSAKQYFRIFSFDVDGYYEVGSRTFGAIELIENNVFVPESSQLYPVLKYTYPIKDGFTMSCDGYTGIVTDENVFFSASDLNNYVWINQPISQSGVFMITNVIDNHTVELDGYFDAFTDGYYQILRNPSAKTGFQNGYFTFEQDTLSGYRYFLAKGNYIFDYSSKLFMNYIIDNDVVTIGNNSNKTSPLNGSLDQIKIENILLEDVRIGEESSNKTITSEYNSLKPVKPTSSTTFLLSNGRNIANYYDRNKNKKLFYTNYHINNNFDDSIHVLKPLQIENDGIFNPLEGTISFWISPTRDGFHENVKNTIFDFYGAITEELESSSKFQIELPFKASQILKVELPNKSEDYFQGGKLSYVLDDTIIESVNLTGGQSSLVLSKPIQQVVSIKRKSNVLAYDLGLDFYGQAGSIGTDMQTVYLGVIPSYSGEFIVIYKPLGINNTLNKQVINLGKPLPSDIMKTKVTYIPDGMVGDRMTLFKDETGLLNLVVKADNKTAQIITPVDWTSGSWHKIKISYSMKNSLNDTISMWIDGYQVSNDFSLDTNYLHSSYDGYNELSFGNVVNYNNISARLNFKDQIHILTFGAMSDMTFPKNFVMDDLKFTNKYSQGTYFAGEYRDLSYSDNLSVVVPSINDLYTTYILSGKSERTLTDNFSVLRNKQSNNNDFYLNIFDSFDIIKNNDKVKLILEKLIKLIKPASSKVYIRYIG